MTTPTLSSLLDTWEAFASSLAGGYDFGLDDYLNDLDVRQLIEQALLSAREPVDERLRKRLETADELVLAATERTHTCLWGSHNAAERGWQSDQNWWYFAMPRERSAEFDDDVEQLS